MEDFKDVVHHSTTTKFSWPDRLRLLVGRPVTIRSKIYTAALVKRDIAAEALVVAGQALLAEFDDKDVLMHTPIAYMHKFETLRAAISAYNDHQ